MDEEVVYLKVFDEGGGDVVFEGGVSTDVEPHELVYLGCFLERRLYGIHNKATNEDVKSFKGLQNNNEGLQLNNVELVAGHGDDKGFLGVLYVDAKDAVLRKSESVPSCECVMMSVWYLSHEECEKVFKCGTLERLDIYTCKLSQIPREIGNLRGLRGLTLHGLNDSGGIPEEIGELSDLAELQIEWTRVGSLPKRLEDLKMLKSISLVELNDLQLNAEDLVVFSKLNLLKIRYCDKVFSQLFWEMIKSTTDLSVLELNWDERNREMVAEALEENGSIVDGGDDSELYTQFFDRNKENHEKALHCVVHLLAIRNAHNGVPKEMVRMIAMMLWNTRCDVGAWTKK